MDRKQRVKELDEKLTNAQKNLRNISKQSGVVKRNLEYEITKLKEEIKKAKDGPKESWDMSL